MSSSPLAPTPPPRGSARLRNAPLIAAINPFLDDRRVKGLARSTVENYRFYLRVFEIWLKQTGNAAMKPSELTLDHVDAFRLFLADDYRSARDRKLSPKSQGFYVIALRALLHYLVAKDIPSLAPEKIELNKFRQDRQVAFLSADELKALLSVPATATPGGLRDRALLELLFSTGMRVSELVALDRARFAALEIAPQDPPKTAKAPATDLELSIVGKGDHTRTIYVSQRAALWLKTYLATRGDDHPPLFLNRQRPKPDAVRLTARAVQRLVAHYALAAGLLNRVTPHVLRHSYATTRLAAGADLRSVQDLLGHQSVATTQIYTHVTNRQLRDTHRKFLGPALD